MPYILSPSPRGPHGRERAYQRENGVSFLSSTPKCQSPAYPHGSSSQRRQTDRARGGSQEVPGRPDGDSAAHWQGRSEVSLTSPYCNLPRISTISTAKPSRSAAAPRDPHPWPDRCSPAGQSQLALHRWGRRRRPWSRSCRLGSGLRACKTQGKVRHARCCGHPTQSLRAPVVGLPSVCPQWGQIPFTPETHLNCTSPWCSRP